MKTISLFLLLATAALADVPGVAFIVHPETKPADLAGLNRDDIKSILLNNRTKWRSGAAIRLVVVPRGPIHEEVAKDFIQKSPEQFLVYWKKQVFTGTGAMPEQAKSDAEIVEFVARTPGGFGYVAKDAVTDSVKVVQLN